MSLSGTTCQTYLLKRSAAQGDCWAGEGGRERGRRRETERERERETDRDRLIDRRGYSSWCSAPTQIHRKATFRTAMSAIHESLRSVCKREIEHTTTHTRARAHAPELGTLCHGRRQVLPEERPEEDIEEVPLQETTQRGGEAVAERGRRRGDGVRNSAAQRCQLARARERERERERQTDRQRQRQREIETFQ